MLSPVSTLLLLLLWWLWLRGLLLLVVEGVVERLVMGGLAHHPRDQTRSGRVLRRERVHAGVGGGGGGGVGKGRRLRADGRPQDGEELTVRGGHDGKVGVLLLVRRCGQGIGDGASAGRVVGAGVIVQMSCAAVGGGAGIALLGTVVAHARKGVAAVHGVRRTRLAQVRGHLLLLLLRLLLRLWLLLLLLLLLGRLLSVCRA